MRRYSQRPSGASGEMSEHGLRWGWYSCVMEVCTGGWSRSKLGRMPRLTRRGARGYQVALERERWMGAAGQVVEPVQRRSGRVVVR
jgi:hypothetical protein